MSRDKATQRIAAATAATAAAAGLPGGDLMSEYQAEDFFFLRTPLLPCDDLERLLAASREDGAGDGSLLLRLAADPEIAEALFVASPELTAGLERAGDLAAGKKNDRLRQSLTRYLLRLSTRPTPFGLFAGGTLGRLGGSTALELGPRSGYRRHTRLDMDYLDRLARDLENDRELRASLVYRPNSSLYAAAGRLRYAEGRIAGEARAYHLVALRPDLFLEAALAAAARGARLGEIARAVAAADPEGEIEVDEAEAFVHELIDTQVLVSDLGPRVTGVEPIHDLIGRLEPIPRGQPAAACLAAVRERLAALDEGPLGASPEVYRALGRRLEELGTAVDLPRLFQVDMSKEARELSLGPEVIEEAKRAIGFLYRLREGGGHDPLAGFREEFLKRYEMGRWVPLAEALDEEAGIGYQRTTAVGSETSPLLAAIAFPGRAAETQIRWGRAQDLLLLKTCEAIGRGATEVRWQDEDLAPLALPAGNGKGGGSAKPFAAKPFYGAFQAIFALAGESAAAVDRGDFKLLFRSASGASGGSLLGRFCHGDGALAESLAAHLRREESHQPDAVFAEIVHLPEGRIGNILLRPRLREYEIPFLGLGGADPERQLPLGDLLVSVIGEEVQLWSRRLGKRVFPRLASAHNYSLRGLGVYRFLSALQHHGTCGGLSWQWGPLEQLPFLPRVVYGRTILAAARWRVEKEELAALFAPGGELLPEKLAAWREARRIPRRVLLADSDNELFVDFASPLTVEAFASIVHKRATFNLIENLQDAEGLVAFGPEGRFTHEILLPFVRRPELAPPKNGGGGRPLHHPAPSHAPGSRWVYAKLYTGTATADGVLEQSAGELARRFGRQIDSFFFLRFADPDSHLRLRFEVGEEGLREELVRQLSAIAGELLADGRIWDFRFETYKPEIERYGGAEGLRQSERIFHADSEAALALLPHLRGDTGAELRWLAALASVDGLIASLFGGAAEARITCAESLARNFAAEFRFDKVTRQTINHRMREKKALLDRALAGKPPAGGADPGGDPLTAALAVLAARDRAIAGPAAELRRLAAAGLLDASLHSLAGSLAHMAVNRLMASEARAHEAVLYEILHRQLLSRQARPAPVAAAT